MCESNYGFRPSGNHRWVWVSGKLHVLRGSSVAQSNLRFRRKRSEDVLDLAVAVFASRNKIIGICKVKKPIIGYKV